jgi:hypothetical protein
MTYKWKPGARISLPAQTFGDRFDWLRKKLGRPITRQDVLDDARDSKSPVHKGFEWNDDVAGEQFRLSQATHMLNCLVILRIKVTNPKDNRPHVTTNVRAFYPVVQNNERGYETTARIMNSLDLRMQLLQEALEELRCFRTKYRKLHELATVFAAVAALKKSLRRKVQANRKKAA